LPPRLECLHPLSAPMVFPRSLGRPTPPNSRYRAFGATFESAPQRVLGVVRSYGTCAPRPEPVGCSRSAPLWCPPAPNRRPAARAARLRRALSEPAECFRCRNFHRPIVRGGLCADGHVRLVHDPVRFGVVSRYAIITGKIGCTPRVVGRVERLPAQPDGDQWRSQLRVVAPISRAPDREGC